MSQMIEVKTAELIGPALDWAVAKVERVTLSEASWKYQLDVLGCIVTPQKRELRYSTDWAKGGPLIERYAVQLEPWAGYWVAKTDCRLGSNHYAKRDGESPLIAACRAIVAAMLGDVVSVPAELVGGAV